MEPRHKCKKNVLAQVIDSGSLGIKFFFKNYFSVEPRLK